MRRVLELSRTALTASQRRHAFALYQCLELDNAGLKHATYYLVRWAKEREPHATVARLAELCEMSERRVKRALKRLQERGFCLD